MRETIYRDEAIRAVRHPAMEFTDADTRQKMIEAIPSADRPQGMWIYTNNPLRLDDEWACNRCGNISFVKTNFCDRCGCRMRKENE